MAACLLVGPRSSRAALMPGLLLGASGTGLFNPALCAVALGEAQVEQSGLAAGIYNAFRYLGIAVGAASLGTLIPTRSLVGDEAPGSLTGYHHALSVGGRCTGCVRGCCIVPPHPRPSPARRPTPCRRAGRFAPYIDRLPLSVAKGLLAVNS